MAVAHAGTAFGVAFTKRFGVRSASTALDAWDALVPARTGLDVSFLGRRGEPRSGTLVVSIIAMAWPAVAFPFVGYIGTFALVFIPIAMVLGFAVVMRTVLERNRLVDLWVLLPNGVWSVLLFVFSLAWDGVYGD